MMGSYESADKREKFSPRDNPAWLGRLFLVWPTSADVVNFARDDGTMEPATIVTADVAIIDLPDPETGRPVFLKDARIGGKAIVPQLEKKIPRGAKVLGRLRQSPSQGQKSGAYYIEDLNPVDVPLAEQYEAAFPRVNTSYAQASDSPPSRAAQQAQAPAPPAWAAQPVQPPAAPVANAWGPPPPAQQVAPPAPGFGYPPGLAEFLQSRGIDITHLDANTAQQIAATLS